MTDPGLRQALAELADEWQHGLDSMTSTGPCRENVEVVMQMAIAEARDLLAAHPAPEPDGDVVEALATTLARAWWSRETGETDQWDDLDADERGAVVENSYAEGHAETLIAAGWRPPARESDAGWLRREAERAGARRAEVPPHARPVVTNPHARETIDVGACWPEGCMRTATVKSEAYGGYLCAHHASAGPVREADTGDLDALVQAIVAILTEKQPVSYRPRTARGEAHAVLDLILTSDWLASHVAARVAEVERERDEKAARVEYVTTLNSESQAALRQAIARIADGEAAWIAADALRAALGEAGEGR